ncbi:MAG: hypothetical protein QOH26_1768, partial [Actinomycetota bacterium]|nr:hypothetical protein [Actinomycetota bacterium]
PFSFLAPVLTRAAINKVGSRNYANLSDPDLEAAIDAAIAETDPVAAKPLWEEANRIATETAAWIPWSWDESAIMLGPDLRGAHYLPFLAQIDWVNATAKRARSS